VWTVKKNGRKAAVDNKTSRTRGAQQDDKARTEVEEVEEEVERGGERWEKCPGDMVHRVICVYFRPADHAYWRLLWMEAGHSLK
jgi:hypothetical protein